MTNRCSSALGIEHTSLLTISLRAVILHRQLEPTSIAPGSLSNSTTLSLSTRTSGPDRLFHHLIPTCDGLAPTRLLLHLQQIRSDDLHFRMEGRTGEMSVGVAGITSNTQSIQRSVIRAGKGAIGLSLITTCGCGSWALAPWQHQESRR